MKVIRIPDRFNSRKVWVVKRYKSGNYYLNQEICSQTFYNGFVRVTRKFLAEILGGKGESYDYKSTVDKQRGTDKCNF